MASDIGIVLTLDDTQYTARLVAAGKAVETLGKTTAAAGTASESALSKMADSVESVSNKFHLLQSAILGAGLTEFIHSAMEFADRIEDMSKATGMTIPKIIEFQQAVAAAGGNAEGAAKGIQNFYTKLDEARMGSGPLQIAFDKLKISLSDLRKMSDQEIFFKTIDELAKMQPGATQARLATELLGKTFKGLSIQEVSQKLAELNGQFDGQSRAIQTAADANKRLEEEITRLKLAALNIFEPFIKELGRLIPNVDTAKTAVAALSIGLLAIGGLAVINSIKFTIDALKGLAIWLGIGTGSAASFASAQAAATAQSARSAATMTALSAATAELTAAEGALAASLRAVYVAETASSGSRAAFTAVTNAATAAQVRYDAAIAGVAAATQIAERSQAAAMATTIASTSAFYRLGATLGTIVGTIIAATTSWAGFVGAITAAGSALVAFLGPVGLVTAGILAIGTAISYAFDLHPLDAMAEKLELLTYRYFPSLAKTLNNIGESLGMAPSVDPATKKENDDEEKRLLARDRANKAKQEQDNRTIAAFREQRLEQEKLLRGYQTEIESNERSYALKLATIGLDGDQLDRINRLAEIETAHLAKRNELINKYRDLQAAAKGGTDEQIAAFGAFNAVYGKTLAGIDSAYRKQVEVTNAQLNQQQILRAREQERKNAIDEINKKLERQVALSEVLINVNDRRVDTRFQSTLIGLSPVQKQNRQIAEDIRKAEMDATRTFSKGFESDDALSPERAQEFADGLTEIHKRFEDLKNAELDNIADAREWSAGWAEAFNTYVDNATNAANHARTIFEDATKGMEDAIINFAHTGKLSFKNMANSIIDDLIKIGLRKSMVGLAELMGFGAKGTVSVGGLFGGLGSLFGGGSNPFGGYGSGSGFLGGFAAGGSVVGNRPILVGERGPELFTPNSGGSITANDQMGTNVVYNINAVDAASFRSMIARDPQFLYNITEVGRRSTPNRRLS
jgi:lambda family phage tail tape measure protein